MMKIAKALKLKNQLAGEVAQLKDLLAKQNVRSKLGKADVDKLADEWKSEIQSLQDALDEFNFRHSLNLSQK